MSLLVNHTLSIQFSTNLLPGRKTRDSNSNMTAQIALKDGYQQILVSISLISICLHWNSVAAAERKCTHALV